MSNHRNIKHPGIIVDSGSNQVVVRIEPQTACGNCNAKSHCSMAGDSGKLIDIPVNDSSKYFLGQKVTVILVESLGYKALLLGYLMPFVLLMITLVTSLAFTQNEGLAAIMAIAILVAYYAFLYRIRLRLRKTFNFSILSGLVDKEC
jgi:sigma-E factor negative regulatory protein RseC